MYIVNNIRITLKTTRNPLNLRPRAYRAVITCYLVYKNLSVSAVCSEIHTKRINTMWAERRNFGRLRKTAKSVYWLCYVCLSIRPSACSHGI